MPELREIQDMLRRARAILPPDDEPPANYNLQFHLEHARETNPGNPPLIGASILQNLPANLPLSQSSLQAYGKSLIIILQPQIFLRVQCYLHGHMLVISESELQEIEEYWSRWVPAARGAIHPHISLCVRAAVAGGPSLIFLDHNKLLRYTAIHYAWPLAQWRPDDCGPDPLKTWTTFKNNILSHKTKSAAPLYLYIKDNQKTFCGLGASMVIEVLHLARIHPLEKASSIFGNHQDPRRQRIVEGIRHFIDWITSPQYCQRVSATSSSVSAFDINRSITKYIVENTHVYRKTQGKAKVSLQLYEELVNEEGLVVEHTPNRRLPEFKYLPVHMWKHNAPNSNKATYSYTVIQKLPEEYSGIVVEVPPDSPAYKVKALRAESNSPDIGISSFYYLLQSALFEQRQAGRPRGRSHSSGRGRPHVVSVPSFGVRQARVDEVYGVQMPEELVRLAEGRLPDEVDEGEILQ